MINDYYKDLDRIPETKMFDREVQAEMARECVGNIDLILAKWKSSRRK